MKEHLNHIKYILILFSLALGLNANGQIKILGLDSSYFIAQPIEIQLEFEPKTSHGLELNNGDTIQNFIVHQIDSAFEENGVLKQQISLITFDTGKVFLPIFSVNSSKSEIKSTYIRLVSVQLTEDFKDIKPIFDAELTIYQQIIRFFKIWWWLFLLIIILIVGYYLMTYFSNKPSKNKESEPIKVVEPHIWANTKLQQLEQQKLWQTGKLKEYHIQLTTIVRKYIEKRYAISAMNQTSDEILNSLNSISLTPIQKENLREILTISDLVKFAKGAALDEQNQNALINAYKFIDQTKTKEEK